MEFNGFAFQKFRDNMEPKFKKESIKLVFAAQNSKTRSPE
jgi:hypothetical protein